jgi:hypothetical protein
MKVGDFVELKPFCKARNRPAVVVEVFAGGMVKIVYADTGEKVTALVRNLVMLSKKG